MPRNTSSLISRCVAVLALLASAPVAALAVAASDGDGYEHPLARLGAWGHPVPLDVQADMGLVPGQGLMIAHVRPGSPAESMGLHPGDVILNLNGAPIASRLDLRTEVLSHQPGDAADVTIARAGGQVQTLSGEFGTRMSKRAPRPLTDAWEQQVKDHQIQELLAEAERQRALAAELAALKHDDDADGDDARSDRDPAATDRLAREREEDEAGAARARALTGPWSVAHRWAYEAPAADTTVSVGDASAPAEGPAWRLAITVPAQP